MNVDRMNIALERKRRVGPEEKWETLKPVRKAVHCLGDLSA